MNFKKDISLKTKTLYCINNIKPYAKNPKKRFSVPLNKHKVIKNNIERIVYMIDKKFILSLSKNLCKWLTRIYSMRRSKDDGQKTKKRKRRNRLDARSTGFSWNDER